LLNQVPFFSLRIGCEELVCSNSPKFTPKKWNWILQNKSILPPPEGIQFNQSRMSNELVLRRLAELWEIPELTTSMTAADAMEFLMAPEVKEVKEEKPKKAKMTKEERSAAAKARWAALPQEKKDERKAHLARVRRSKSPADPVAVEV